MLVYLSCLLLLPLSLSLSLSLSLCLSVSLSLCLSVSLSLCLPPSLLPPPLSPLPPLAPVSVNGLSLSLPCLKEGQNVRLRCNISGFPRPVVSFTFDGNSITPGEGIYANSIQRTFYDEVSCRDIQPCQYSSLKSLTIFKATFLCE